MSKTKKIYQLGDGSFLSDDLQPDSVVLTPITQHKSTRYINIKIRRDQERDANGAEIQLDKRMPELYENKQDCCGCGTCFSICPMTIESKLKDMDNDKFITFTGSKHNKFSQNIKLTGAITMCPDEEGFLYPVIDASICIRCYQCMQFCPIHIH